MRTLHQFVDRFIQSRRALGIYNAKSVRVVRPRLYLLADHFGGRPLSQYTPRAIEAWLGSLDVAVNSKAAYLCSARKFSAWLLAEGVIAADPCVEILAIKRVRPIPRAQSSEAIAATLAACTTDRDRAIVWLMVGLGLRRMEVAGLRWEHYDEKAALLSVRQAKNSKERLLPVTDEVASALANIRGRGLTGPIIRSQSDPSLGVSPEWIGTLAARVMWAAGVKHHAYDGISGHALRHTAASDVLEKSGDLQAVQAMLGHENLSTTATYLRLTSPARLREAMSGRSYTASVVDALAARRRRPPQDPELAQAS